MHQQKQEFGIALMKCMGTIFLTGSFISTISYLVYRYSNKKYKLGWISNGLMKIGIGIALLGFCGFMATGH